MTMTPFAKVLDAIPVVPTTAYRNTFYPSTTTINQRVQNLETGDIERWDGSVWQVDFEGAAASANPIHTGSAVPNGAVVGSPGWLYLQAVGTTGAMLWQKQTGTATNTGWVATQGTGTGSPEAVFTATVGATYAQSDGTNGAAVWAKRTGTGNTGWAQVPFTLGVFNVKDYGAKGDSTTDDTAAIQAAITAASVAGGIVYVPFGCNSKLTGNTENLTINASNVTLWVDGQLLKDGSGSTVYVGSTTTVSNVRILGNGKITPTVVPHASPSAGIKVGAAGVAVDGLTIGLNVVSMGQYGIVSGSTSATITNFVLLDGTLVSVDPTGWITGAGIGQAMDFNVPSGSQSGGYIGAVQFSIVDSIGLTDCFKWTNFTGRIVGASFTGGTVDQLHLGQATEFVVSGVTLAKTATGGTGLTFASTCSNGVVDGVEATTVTTTVPMVYFGASAVCSNLDLANIRTNGAISQGAAAACTTVHLRNITAASCIMLSGTFSSGSLNGYDGGQLYFTGNSNRIHNFNVDMGGAATPPLQLVGNTNKATHGIVKATTLRGVYLQGDGNYLTNITADACTAAAYRVVSGTSNIIGQVFPINGTPKGEDAGTTTVFLFQGATTTAAAPSGTTSTSEVMMGVAAAYTPLRTGNVLVIASGNFANSTLSDGATVRLRSGTGTAPTNGAAATGTQRGITQTYTAKVAAEVCAFGFSQVFAATLGTALWFDIGLNAVTAGTATVTGVHITVTEV